MTSSTNRSLSRSPKSSSRDRQAPSDPARPIMRAGRPSTRTIEKPNSSAHRVLLQEAIDEPPQHEERHEDERRIDGERDTARSREQRANLIAERVTVHEVGPRR